MRIGSRIWETTNWAALRRTTRTRFAPSPTGDLHVGGALCALASARVARAERGSFVVRVEDLDTPRVVAGSADRILDDLEWLGLGGDEGPRAGGPVGPYVQSARLATYAAAVDALTAAGLTYPCDCSRAEIALVASAPHEGEDVIYPGTCRNKNPARAMRRPAAIRFRVAGSAARRDGANVEVAETAARRDGANVEVAGSAARRDGANVEVAGSAARRDGANVEVAGTAARRDGANVEVAGTAARRDGANMEVDDFVLRRGDGVFSYQLAVSVDDLAMAIGCVVRGADLASSTSRQLAIMRALGARDEELPRYVHLPLVRDAQGQRISKRTRGSRVRGLREAGVAASEILAALEPAVAGHAPFAIPPAWEAGG